MRTALFGHRRAAVRCFFFRSKGNPEIHGYWLDGELEARGHHADDGIAPAVQHQPAPQDSRVATESLLPRGMAQQHGVIALHPWGIVFFRQKRSADLRGCAEKREEIG